MYILQLGFESEMFYRLFVEHHCFNLLTFSTGNGNCSLEWFIVGKYVVQYSVLSRFIMMCKVDASSVLLKCKIDFKNDLLRSVILKMLSLAA